MHLPAASKGNPGPSYFIDLSCAIEHRCTMYEELAGGGEYYLMFQLHVIVMTGLRT